MGRQHSSKHLIVMAYMRLKPLTAINVTSFSVIQVKPGIGDVIWHLPFIRAIAATAPERQVTFFAPPTSAARDLLAAEPRVAATV
jgi:heptosyltransferase-2